MEKQRLPVTAIIIQQGFTEITVSHQVSVKLKTERLQISQSCLNAKRWWQH
tara:strand:- start:124 stop:276 length:153 start_codon:yes stop_codon:yes gene_type:complete